MPYETQVMQVFETLDNMRNTLDAPGEYFAIIEDNLNGAMYHPYAVNMTPEDILDAYMDNLGECALLAKTNKSRMMFESLASITKKLKEFYLYDLFDNYMNYPVED